MFKHLNIMLCFLLFSASGKISAQDNFKIFYPELLKSGASFEVCFIGSTKFSDSKKLLFYFHPDFSLTINKVELWTSEKRVELTVKQEFVEEYLEEFQAVTLDFSDTSVFNDDVIFQVVLFLRSNQATANSLKFFGKLIDDEGNEDYLINSDPRIITGNPNLYNLSFNYYERFALAEDAILLLQDSYLNVPLVFNFKNELSAEFWFKLKNFTSAFMEIINWETNRVEYFISVSDNQMLVIDSRDKSLLPVKSQFLSQNIWHHMYLTFNKVNSEITFFCNDMELTRIKVTNNIEFDNLVLHYQNDSPQGEIALEQFRLVKLDGTARAIKSNKNYSDFSDDSSEVLLQIHFSESELNSYLNQKTISYQKIQLIKSEAPIFPRAPEINVRLMKNFYEIEWTGGSYEDARKYIVEKAEGNNAFIEIGRQTAENNTVKNYSMLAERTDDSEILFFRIKQVNKDGTEIYSDVVKIGLGNIEDVVISQNYPNPFNPATSIEFQLLIDTDVEIKVFDLAGKEIAVLHSGFLKSGVHKFKFDATGYPSGIYLYQIKTPHSSQTRKMILTK